ncbi:hypothetical protein TSAR_014476, partial [Trichomalopsis sarcophagae]
NIEDFVIENNIIKGVDQDFGECSGIGEHLLSTLSSKPDHVAQIEAETGKQTTFAEMKDRSVRCGIWLKKQGIGANDIVVICSKNNLDLYAPMFGTFYAGGTFSGWSPFIASPKPVQRLMKLFKPKIVFAGEDVVDILHKAAKLENVKTKFVVFGRHSNFKTFHDIIKIPSEEDVHDFRAEKVNLKDNAVIILTSGSTGFSKGVQHNYENLFKIIVGLTPYPMAGVALWYSTCDWVTGVTFALQSVLLIGTRIMHTQFDVEETCKVIEKYKVNLMLASSVIMASMLKLNVFKRYNLQSLKFVCTGGSKTNALALKGFHDALPNALIVQMYGMTEIGRSIASQTENSKSIGSAGFVISCNQLKIVDIENGESLGPNKPGEICIRSPTMMTGYFNNPEETKKVLDNDGWLSTGDKGFYDENGEVHVIERLKEMMKYQNHQISPSEVEQVLLSHPAVMEVSVIPIPHYLDGDWPIAFVKKVPEFQVTEDELVQLSISVFGELKKLHGGVKFVEQLPKMPNGKINRSLLKEMAKAMSINS